MTIAAREIGREAPAPATHARAVPAVPLSRAALFLDLDGTLAEFRSTPCAVEPDPVRTELVRRLQDRLDGRLAVVSGRTIEEIDRILEGAALNAAGVHGLERRIGGEVVRMPAHPELPWIEQELRAFADDRPGVLLERKSLSAALHYRLAPGQAEPAVSLARELADRTGLRLLHGEKVVELRTPGADKGSAVAAFMAQAPFDGAVPIFLGDDVTDEDAFALVESSGGIGVLVGPERDSAASARLPGVSEVLQWLERSLRAGMFEFESRGVA